MNIWKVIIRTALVAVALVLLVVPQLRAQVMPLEITALEGGTTKPPPGIHPYELGTVVKIEAVPDTGWSLVKWTVTPGGDSTSKRIYVTMDQPRSVVVEFENNYNATVRSFCLADNKEVFVDLDMDGSPVGVTPQSYVDIEGEHTFTVPDFDPDGCPFAKWNTGETNTTITIKMEGRYTAYYGRTRVPSLTEWGMLVLLVMLVAGGVLVMRRRRPVATP